MAAIELENVYKAYGQLPVLRGLNLYIETGETYGLLGPNGAGKSTLIHLMLGFLRPQQGQVRVLGTNELNRNQGQVGYLPERLRYHARFSAREYLRALGKIDGMREPMLSRRIETELEAVGLLSAANRQLGTFSRGMLQRVGIAQALLHEPKLLLVDEPTSGLDPTGQSEVLAVLAGLRGRGVTVLLATHYLNEIEQACDRVGILYNGRIAAEATVGSLEQASANVVIATDGIPELAAERLARISSAVQVAGRELRIAPNSHELQARTLRVLIDFGVTVLTLQPQQRPLEELYRRVTNGEPVDRAYAPRKPATADAITQSLPNSLFAPPGHPDTLVQDVSNGSVTQQLQPSEEQDRA